MNNYPLIISFDKLPDHIYKFKDDLIKIINNIAKSYYLNLAKQIYYSIGHKKALMPMMLINRFQDLRVSDLFFFFPYPARSEIYFLIYLYNCIEFKFNNAN